MLASIILSIYGVLAIVPIFPFVLVGVITYFVKQDKKQAVQLAMDVTTFFLVGVVAAMLDEIFPGSSINGIWIVLLVLILLTGLLGNAQTRLKGKVNYKKLIRVVWRMGFVLLSLLYVIFLIVGVAKTLG